MKLKLIVVALVLASPAHAANWTSTEVRGSTCGVTTFKTVSIPASAKVDRIRVFANGGELEGYAVGKLSAWWFGRGAAVAVNFTRAKGPATFRVANMRPRGCTRFRATVRWYV